MSEGDEMGELHERRWTGLEVAVVGMAGRFPGAPDLAAFWRNLAGGVESISFFSPDELAVAGQDRKLIEDPRFVPAQAVLEGADLFDAAFFGYGPREAEIMDPQQRLFLECAWDAVEDAGYAPGAFAGLIGVYGSTSASSYLFQILSRPDLVEMLGVQQIALGNDKDFLCSRVSYKLGLEGPSVVVQSACSSSLVATHLACQALLNGECDMALAGGVSVSFPQCAGYLYQEGGIASRDGHCRTFDARATGSVSGQGVGLVALKRLVDARRDGDSIRAVILGSAINNDGGLRPGFTAPKVEGQSQVVRAAHRMAGIAPSSLALIEAHGTATALGDPIEVAALAEAFRAETDERGFCAVGSVKTNIGHLDAAAGIAGLIKTVLALEAGEIPPSLGFEAPNPEVDFESSPFYVPRLTVPWPDRGGPRRAAVSSFGLGGTNAHAVLEQAPTSAPRDGSAAAVLLPLSARSEDALDRAALRLADHLRHRTDLALADVAYTLQVGRRRFERRRVLVCGDRDEAIAALSGTGGRRLDAAGRGAPPSLAFLFAGLGDHYPGMAAGLYRSAPPFRREIDRASEVLLPILGVDLREILFPPTEPDSNAPAGGGAGPDLRSWLAPSRHRTAEDRPLDRTALAQPAMFALEYALAQLWQVRGARPGALLGYSLGEYVAACLAGVFSFEDGLHLVARRAQLIETLPPGAMLAVPLAEEQLAPWLGGDLWLCAINGETLCVVGGSVERVTKLEVGLGEAAIPSRRIQTRHAFHSPMMAPIADPLAAVLRSVDLRPARLPLVSNVTGDWLDPERAAEPAYWIEQLLRPVRFADGLATLLAGPDRLLLEIGPGQTLGSLALQHPSRREGQPVAVLPTLRHELDRQSDEELDLRTLGQLWLADLDVDWTAHNAARGDHRRVPLPTYPFERRRFWIERGAQQAASGARLADDAGWFWAPSWRLAPPRSEPSAAAHGAWLLLLDPLGLGERLAGRLAEMGVAVATARPGDRFAQVGARDFVVARGEDRFEPLFEALGGVPERIVHLWSLTSDGDPPGLEEIEDAAFFSLLALSRALARRSATRVEISVVTDGLYAVERGDRIKPEKSLLLGPVRVMPQEMGIACRAIDVDPNTPLPELLDELLDELATPPAASSVARRGGRRWLPDVVALRLEATAGPKCALLRERGVYLITGGLGGIGLGLARHLATGVGARLALLGRTELPSRGEWANLREAGGPLGHRLREVEALEAGGAEVLLLAADVADPIALRAALDRVDRRFGRLDGVFHAAGMPGAGLIALKTSEMARRVLAPKVAGTLALKAALEERPVDFLVLFSSLSALAGGIGQVDYCAANAFLGACAESSAAAGSNALKIFAVDWCEWRWDSWSGDLMPLPAEVRAELAGRRQSFGLSFDEGFGALARILDRGLPRIAVSTRDLPAMLAESHSLSAVVEGLEQALPPASAVHSRPLLGVPFEPPRDDLERRLARLWCELLGLAEVGVRDRFVELGGHSLLGLRLISRMRDELGIELPLRVLFDAPTIAELAVAIREVAAPAAPSGLERRAVEMDLSDLDRLPEAELDRLLAQLASEVEEAEP